MRSNALSPRLRPDAIPEDAIPEDVLFRMFGPFESQFDFIKLVQVCKKWRRLILSRLEEIVLHFPSCLLPCWITELHALKKLNLCLSDPATHPCIGLSVVPHASSSSLHHLANLRSLEHLTLSGNLVEDVSALESLTTLEYLRITTCRRVTDVSALLKSLTSLRTLHLDHTSVKDVSDITALTCLRDLTLAFTNVADISTLAGLTTLRSLCLCKTPVCDVSALAGLVALTNLCMRFTSVSDLSALAGLTNLNTLALSGTFVSDVSVLRNLASLRLLEIFEMTHAEMMHPQGIDVSVLSGITGLRVIRD